MFGEEEWILLHIQGKFLCICCKHTILRIKRKIPCKCQINNMFYLVNSLVYLSALKLECTYIYSNVYITKD